MPPIVEPPDRTKYAADLGWPGQFPFTRGIQPTMYRGRLWTMRQYAGFGTAEETNARFQHLLSNGQTGLSTAFDLPTQMGYDSDHPMALGEVGRVGVAISSVEDMETLLQGIPLDQVSTSMTINSTAAILLCFYLAIAKRRGLSFKSLRGTIQNDVLKEYIARGTFIFPPGPSLRIVTDLIAFCAKEVPQWNPISISGYHIREAGSDAVQEVAFTMANACAYADATIRRGLEFDEFAGQLSFFFAAHNDFIEEIAKFRAARRLWAKIARERFGAKEDRSMLLRFHVQTAGSTLTAQQPNNNLVRVTLQALAAILGGCQSLHTNSRDEALGLPTELSATLALRTQQILAEESGVANTIDPVGGSYAVEAETDRIEAAAKNRLDEIEGMGGSLRAIERGYFQKSIAERAYQYQQEIERKERGIVGVNVYTTDAIHPPPILRVDPVLEKRRKARLAKLRNERDTPRTERALLHLGEAARSEENLVPFILTAVEALATLGEISDRLRTVFGQYHSPDALV
ncbi:MAG TPA: methylmalonyl-CoA mutase family protein [Bdellovibrionota bacterium]|nr:methylmalonyl-CoA mutase family protein [Bdellovibrionota bacterium]